MLFRSLAVVLNVVGTVFLTWVEPRLSLYELLFEQISAFGTVGLSCGITPQLSAPAQLWIIATMFIGRIGPLTLVVWVLESERARIRYPEGHVMIG